MSLKYKIFLFLQIVLLVLYSTSAKSQIPAQNLELPKPIPSSIPIEIPSIIPSVSPESQVGPSPSPQIPENNTLSPLPEIVPIKPTLPESIDAIKKYDELINPSNTQKSPESALQTSPTPESTPTSEIYKFLPNLNDVLLQGWISESSILWMNGEPYPDFISIPQQIANDLFLNEVIKQVYVKDNHKTGVLIYRFKDFTGAYSAYTLFHKGEKAKLKIGRNASEAENLINFWKGNYFVDLHTAVLGDVEAKKFVTLASQDISKNIISEQIPPVVAVQLPALNRIKDSEKYCFTTLCAIEFLPKIEGIDYFNLNIPESGGIISARYKVTDNPKEKDEAILLLTRYIEKETSKSVFNSIKSLFEEKAKADKNLEVKFDQDESKIVLKNKKTFFLSVKQKGNLLGISFSENSKKNSEKILELIPWPIEVIKTN